MSVAGLGKMNTLRILLLGPYPPSPDTGSGGVASSTQAVASALISQPEIENLTILCFHQNVDRIRQVRINEKLYLVFAPSQRHLALPTRSLLEWQTARWLVKQDKFDLVYGKGLDSYGDIATRLGLPSVISVHGIMLEEINLLRQTIGVKVRKWLIKSMICSILTKAEAIIAISQYSKQFTQIARGPVHVIPNPLGEPYLNIARDTISPISSHLNLLYLGHLSPLKNIVGLVRSFYIASQSCPEAKLWLAGYITDVEYWKAVQHEIEEHKLTERVIYLGNLDTRGVIQALSNCRALVHFSHQENLPNSILEAMALGRPVIASDVGGVGDLIEDGWNGFLVKRNDINGFAEKMAMVLKEPDLAQLMGKRGYEKAHANFHPAKIAQQMVDVFKQVVNPLG